MNILYENNNNNQSEINEIKNIKNLDEYVNKFNFDEIIEKISTFEQIQNEKLSHLNYLQNNLNNINLNISFNTFENKTFDNKTFSEKRIKNQKKYFSNNNLNYSNSINFSLNNSMEKAIEETIPYTKEHQNKLEELRMKNLKKINKKKDEIENEFKNEKNLIMENFRNKTNFYEIENEKLKNEIDVYYDEKEKFISIEEHEKLIENLFEENNEKYLKKNLEIKNLENQILFEHPKLINNNNNNNKIFKPNFENNKKSLNEKEYENEIENFIFDLKKIIENENFILFSDLNYNNNNNNERSTIKSNTSVLTKSDDFYCNYNSNENESVSVNEIKNVDYEFKVQFHKKH